MSIEQLFEQDRVSRQELADSIALLSGSYKNFLLDVCPRLGKSLLAVSLINKWLTDDTKILILSSANSTNNQWIENITKYNPHLLNRIEVYCYQSLHKLDREQYDIICLDEFVQSHG